MFLIVVKANGTSESSMATGVGVFATTNRTVLVRNLLLQMLFNILVQTRPEDKLKLFTDVHFSHISPVFKVVNNN